MTTTPISTDQEEMVESVMSGVRSWDEFTTLREVVVGDATHARLPSMADPSAWLTCYPQLDATQVVDAVATGEFPRRVLDEAAEDLTVLADTLRGLGVRVRRPAVVDHGQEFATPDWRSAGFMSYCPRDVTLVLGETIIETSGPMRARYFEHFALRELCCDYLLAGSRWIAAPRPRLADDLFGVDGTGHPVLGETEPVFDAANVLRIGRDVLYQVSRSGNELGLRWLQSVAGMLGEGLRVHPLRGVYPNTHIDSTIMPLRPGLVLLNPARIPRDRIPEPLRGWDVLWCPEPVAAPDPTSLSESWIAMNLLMVAPDLAIVDAGCPELLRALERHGITVVPLSMRHARTMGGGFHCVTLDTVRDGGPEDYLS